MQGVLTDIELDIQELKYLMDTFTREPNPALREVIRRNILQMRGRLDALLLEFLTVVETDQPVLPRPIEKKQEESPAPILGERIKTATELYRSISLNDSFRFSRELFNGDTEQMNRVLQQIGEMSTYPAAVSFLISKAKADEENEAMADLLELLKKYFN